MAELMMKDASMNDRSDHAENELSKNEDENKCTIASNRVVLEDFTRFGESIIWKLMMVIIIICKVEFMFTILVAHH